MLPVPMPAVEHDFMHNVSICSPNKDKAGAIWVCTWEISSTRPLSEAIFNFIPEYQYHFFKMWPSRADLSLTYSNGSRLILLSPLKMETVTKILIKMCPLSFDGAICPPPHELRKGDYWIRHHLSIHPSVRPLTSNNFTQLCLSQ